MLCSVVTLAGHPVMETHFLRVLMVGGAAVLAHNYRAASFQFTGTTQQLELFSTRILSLSFFSLRIILCLSFILHDHNLSILFYILLLVFFFRFFFPFLFNLPFFTHAFLRHTSFVYVKYLLLPGCTR